MTALKLPVAAPLAAWQRAVPLLLALAVVLWLLRGTGAAMVGIWARSDTFAHAFLVPPIALALMWRKRTELSQVEIRPSPLWLLPLAACCAVWLLGQLAGVHSAAQTALVATIVCAVPAVLGTRLARIIAFPLLFLFFSVPVGEFLIEPMMEGTADFTVAALRLSGIPVYREGLQFVIPSGNWSVVAACSGVRYLIASVMVGTLFAYLNFHSLKRRLAFIAVAIAVPVVANWLRAYMIVMLGHLSSNKLAAGADHLIYGWIFFGVVILLMFMVGSRFVDAPALAAATATAHTSSEGGGGIAHRPGPWLAAAAVGLIVAATQGLQERVDATAAAVAPSSAPVVALPVRLPVAGSSGTVSWQASDEPITRWLPAYRNAAAFDSAQYRPSDGDAGDAVGVWVGLYRDQGHDRKMITSTNVLVEEGSTAWLALAHAPGRVALPAGAAAVELRATQLRAPADPRANPTQRLLVWRVYRVAGRFVAGDAQAMLWLALQRLSGHGDDSAVLMFYTRLSEEGQGAERLQRFVAQHLNDIAASLDATSGRAPTRR
ncbi:MAG: exosortase A [Burkholderiales bacterium]|nr:exosortase A [Burkholderiales bacterium]